MKKPSFAKLYSLAKDSLSAVLAVAATTIFLLLGRRDVIGEGVIALVFLFPVTWAAYSRGLGAGMSAALTAALMFDFFFIPPYYTFTVGRPEGWLILGIFFVVAIVVVERIQSTLAKARTSEQEAVSMYEFSTLLAGLRSQHAIALNVARFIRQRYLAEQVIVWIQLKTQPAKTISTEPGDKNLISKPDCILPILTSWGLVGEVQIWRSADAMIPSPESRLFRNIALQIGLAIERVQITEYELEHISTRSSVLP
jgi:two-component system sensor histidine kinase KdpD